MSDETTIRSQSGSPQSAKSNTVGLLFFAILILAGYSLFSVYFANVQWEKAMGKAVNESLLLDQARMAQVHFKIQVQDWKNLLLRGENPEERAKYLQGISESSENVQKTLRQVLDSPSLPSEFKQEIGSILVDHQAILPSYRKAFENYRGIETLRTVDQSVFGIDQALNQRIDRFALRMMESRFSMMERLKQEARDRYLNVRLTITLMTLGILLMIGFLLWKNINSTRSQH
jgi:methyl-accepting chemotaxis protein